METIQAFRVQDLSLRQIYVGSRNGVMYVDGGWQTFVDGLQTADQKRKRKDYHGEKGNEGKKD